MKSFTLTIIFALITIAQVSAKKAFSGYVINTDGEKIEGQVVVVSPTYNELKVKFIHTNNKKETFKAKELTEYGFEVKKYNRATKSYKTIDITYVRKVVEDAPVRFGATDIMVERQVNGEVKVYNQYTEADAKIGGKVQHFFYVETTNGIAFTKVTKRNYKKVMKAATASLPALQELVGTKGYGYKHIAKIAKTYNETIASRNTLASVN